MGLLYTNYKLFHFKEKLDSLPREVCDLLPPVHIRIKPTNACNHNCRYCAYRVGELQLGRDMDVRDEIPRDKMLEIVEDVVGMGVRAVTFSGGGEPFVYPHLLEAAQGLVSGGVKIASLTNGGNLRGAPAELFAHEASWVRVSIDGWDDESYSRYRGVKHGEFTRVLDNLRAFKGYGGPCRLGASMIVDRENAAHVHELIARLRDTGIDSVKVSAVVIGDDSAENNAYHEPIFELVKNQIARATEEFASADFEVFDAFHQLDARFSKDYSWCPMQQVLMVIGADMNVYPCQDKAYNLETGLLGSIADVRFRDWWFSDKSRFFRIDPSRDCDHHCVSNTKNKAILEYLGADLDHLGFV
ncbi:MAG: radical SAM protein [Actinobacteria bacterium]|nr:MAG: radical SAM protein [Actinomycetota bacterium]